MNEIKSWDVLYEKYPVLFEKKDKSPMASCMAFGIECGLGWYDLLSSVCWRVTQHEQNIQTRKKYKLTESEEDYSPVKFDQIKEKYGGLRIYFSGGDSYIEGLVSMAESFSYQVCEVCGEKGRPNKSGWISTLCDKCRNKDQWNPPEFPG